MARLSVGHGVFGAPKVSRWPKMTGALKRKQR